MNFEPEVSSQAASDAPEAIASPSNPLIRLRDTERSLRVKTVETLLPVLPENLADSLEAASNIAETSLDELADIDLDEISDVELRPVRIQMGLVFVGLGALAIVLLLLYLNSLHPELTTSEQVRNYWYPYIGFVSLGVAGMLMLGREAMR